MAIDSARLTAGHYGCHRDPVVPDLAARLRAQFPPLTFTVCADNVVIGARPAQGAGLRLHLIDGSDPGLHLSSAPALASGVLVAWTETAD